MSRPQSPPSGSAPRDALAILGIPMMALLVLEFLLGMGLNLFESLPGPGVGAGALLLSSPLLLAHLLVAVLLVGITLRAILLSRSRGNRAALAASTVAAVSVIVALLAGLSFVFGSGSDSASYAMSVGFGVALLGATGLLWATRSAPTGPDARVSHAGSAPESGEGA